jgi:hypothetical protein
MELVEQSKPQIAPTTPLKSQQKPLNLTFILSSLQALETLRVELRKVLNISGRKFLQEGMTLLKMRTFLIILIVETGYQEVFFIN